MKDENSLIVGVGPVVVYPPTVSDGSRGRPVAFGVDDRFVIMTGDGPRMMLVADGTEVIVFDVEVDPFGGNAELGILPSAELMDGKNAETLSFMSSESIRERLDQRDYELKAMKQGEARRLRWESEMMRAKGSVGGIEDD